MTQKLLYTVGYEGADLGEFIATLEAYSIQQIIDVRELPLSRKRGFSKTALAAALEKAGIKYLHLKPLGDPKPGREAARSGDITRFRRIYLHHLSTDQAQEGLGNARAAAKKMTSSLLCYERNHTDCHRSIIAEKLKVDFKVNHLTIPVLTSKRRKSAHDVSAAFTLG